jgi:hypothetical protein
MQSFYKVVASTSIPIPLHHQTPTSSLPGARTTVSSALTPVPRIPHKLLQRPSRTRYNIPATLRRHRTTFNHASVERLRRLVNAHPVLQRLRSSSPSPATSPCEPCHYGKQTKAPHSTDPVPAPTAVMDKISGDTAGPMPTSSQGNRFFTVLVDRASKFRSFNSHRYQRRRRPSHRHHPSCPSTCLLQDTPPIPNRRR